MSEVLSKIRKELYKLSEIDFDEDDSLTFRDFIENITYLRKASEEEIINKFRRISFSEEQEGLKFLFFIRNKNGLGERRIFRVIIKYLANKNPYLISNNLKLIPKYGRWDDLYALFDTSIESKVITLFKNQIQKDLVSKKPSTLGKWLKSENSSSKESKALGTKTRLLLNYSPKDYRKTLSLLRKKLNLIETNLSAKEYSDIKYYNLSKTNIKKYRKALSKNDTQNYNSHLNSKFYTKDFIPTEIVKYLKTNTDNDILNNLIERLQSNIIDENKKNIYDSLVINGLNINEKDEILSLLIFTIDLYKKINLNAFKNYYISFKNSPKFNKIYETNFFENAKFIYDKYTNYNIDLNLALDLLLFTLLRKNINYNSEPRSVLFIYNDNKNIDFNISENTKEKWLKSGYELPKIKLWNFKNLNKNFCITKENDIIYISGYNQSAWSYLLEANTVSNSEIIVNNFNKSKIDIIY